MEYTYRTNGPSSIFSNRTILNNSITNAERGNPFKPSTMSQGSMFSNARAVYIKDSGGGQRNNYSGSDYIYLKKINAIGKSSTITNSNLSYSGVDKNYKNSKLARVRSGGSVAPKKKGAIENTFKG